MKTRIKIYLAEKERYCHGVCNNSNTTNAICGAVTAYPPGAHAFTSGS